MFFRRREKLRNLRLNQNGNVKYKITSRISLQKKKKKEKKYTLENVFRESKLARRRFESVKNCNCGQPMRDILERPIGTQRLPRTALQSATGFRSSHQYHEDSRCANESGPRLFPPARLLKYIGMRVEKVREREISGYSTFIHSAGSQ